jgi:hypothetical protein
VNARGARRACARVGLAVAVMLAGLASSVPAGAAPAWTFVPTAAGAAYGRLAGVACPSASMCFAVGGQDTHSTVGKVIQRWNGKKWTVAATPNPSGAISSTFAAVHCVSTVSCVAVGQYNTPIATKTMIMRWDGHTWTVQPSPNAPASPVNSLAGVTCTSSTNCFAVGVSYASTATSAAQSTLIERWDGATWSIVPSPNQPFANDSSVAGVACVSATSCFAVGNYDTATITNTLVEHWDGVTWSIVPSPNPSTSRFNELGGVSCASNGVCFAVGAANLSLVERWNGTTWKIVRSPNPKGATAVSFTDVSCVSAARCVAVGDQLQTHVVQRVVEMWNGSRWTVVNVPVPKGTKKSDLSGVSCAPSMRCFAVGAYRVGPNRRPLLEHYA